MAYNPSATVASNAVAWQLALDAQAAAQDAEDALLAILENRVTALEHPGGQPTPTPSPAPSFTSSPTIQSDGTPQVGEQLLGVDAATANLGANMLRRAWLVGNTPVVNATTVTPTSAVPHTYRNQIVDANGNVLATVSTTISVAAATSTPTPAPTPTPTPGELQRLTLSSPLHYGVAANVDVTNAQQGSTLKVFRNLQALDQYGGLTIGTDKKLSGTPTVRSLLLRETLNGVSRDTLIFATETAPRTMKLGMNVAGVNYYSPNDQFLDYLKCAEIRTPPATADANGMPLTLKPGPYGGYEAAYMVPMPDSRGAPVGEGPVKFRVITDGDMDFSILGFPADGYDGPGMPNTQLVKEGSDWVFTWDCAGAGKVIAYFKINGLRTAPTYIGLVRDSEAALYRAGKICRPGFAADMAGFAHIRWLNQSDANMADPCLTPTNYISYATQEGIPRRVSLEMQVNICLELGIGGWFHEHIKVTDAENAAHDVQYQRMVTAGLPCKKELSNEIWNGQFAQCAYAASRATALGYVEGSPPDYNSYEGGPWFNGYRTAQLAAQDRGKGYKWCVGCQPANPSQASRVLQGFAVANGVKTDISIWTTANYMTGVMNTSENVATEQFDEQLRMVATGNYDGAIDNVVNFARGSATANIPVYQAAVATANANGWTCECYEGTSCHLNSASGEGQVINRPGYDSFLLTTPDAPAYAGAITQNLELTQATGIKCATVFDYNSAPTSSIFGRFGIKRTAGWAALRSWLDNGGATAPIGVSPTPTPTPTPTPAPSPTGYTYVSYRPLRTADQPVGTLKSSYPSINSFRLYDDKGAVVPIAELTGDQQDSHPLSALIDGDDETAWWGHEGFGANSQYTPYLPFFARLATQANVVAAGIKSTGIRSPGDFEIRGHTALPPTDGTGGTLIASAADLVVADWARAGDGSLPEHRFPAGS